MKFIIFICNRLRQGQFPRLPDFPYNEQLGKYIYGGKLMSLSEFNAACERVFDPNYRTSGFTFRPEAIDTDAIPAPAPAATISAEIEPDATEPDIDSAPVTTEPDADERKQLGDALANPEPGTTVADGPASFAQIDNDIYFEGLIVGRLFDGKLKMVKGYGELRAKTEEFLASITENPAAESLV